MSKTESFIDDLREYSPLITLFSSFIVAGSIVAQEAEYSIAGNLLFISGLFGIVWVSLKTGLPFLRIPESGLDRFFALGVFYFLKLFEEVLPPAIILASSLSIFYLLEKAYSQLQTKITSSFSAALAIFILFAALVAAIRLGEYQSLFIERIKKWIKKRRSDGNG